VQKVGALQCACALGEGECGAQPGEVVAEHVSDRALCNVMSEGGRTAQVRDRLVFRVLNEERRSTLNDPVGQPHVAHDTYAIAPE
jgi:hypothetical protein